MSGKSERLKLTNPGTIESNLVYLSISKFPLCPVHCVGCKIVSDPSTFCAITYQLVQGSSTHIAWLALVDFLASQTLRANLLPLSVMHHQLERESRTLISDACTVLCIPLTDLSKQIKQNSLEILVYFDAYPLPRTKLAPLPTSHLFLPVLRQNNLHHEVSPNWNRSYNVLGLPCRSRSGL